MSWKNKLPKSPKQLLSTRSGLIISLGLITLVILLITLLPFSKETFWGKQYPKPYSRAETIPQPAHLGWRLNLAYQKNTGNLVLKKKTVTGVLPQPPRQPQTDDQYLNFKIKVSGEKSYENWVVLKKSFMERGDAEYEFTVDIPFEKGKVEIEKQNKVVIRENLE